MTYAFRYSGEHAVVAELLADLAAQWIAPTQAKREPSAPSAAIVVDENRHGDLLKLAGRLARDVHAGMARESALTTLHAEAARGRWTRGMQPGEIENALDGALAKLASGEWNPPTIPPAQGARAPLAAAIAHGWKLDRIGNLLEQPPRTQWLVRGILERNVLTSLFGQSGHGKSFVAADIAASVATGTDWHGHKVHGGPVMFLAGEGNNGLRKRFAAWQLERGISLSDAQLFVSSAAIDVGASRDTIVASIEDACAGVAPALVIVDTLARHIGSGDENSTQDMGVFVSACDEIKARLSCTVLVIHHTGHGNTDRARGSSSWFAALDWEWQTTKGDGGPILLKCRKTKDFDLPDPMQFELRGVELPWLDDEGEHERSAVLYPSAVAVAATGGNQLVAMEHLRKLLAEFDGFVTMKAWRAATQLDRKRWPEVRDSLVSTGAVVIEGDYVRLP